MYKYNRVISLLIAFAMSAVLAGGILPAQAQGLGGALKSGLEQATPAELKAGQTELPVIVGNIISTVIGILGVVLLIYLILGGYKYMTARGDSKKVTEAIDTIRNAIIGLIIVVLAFAIAGFVIDALTSAVEPGQVENQGP
ncbi:MAG: MMCAP2_0565 family pilin-like conjugal transfer protein [Patescibacteria group bacterium]|nr:pilin [Patescibacteria group bacterium]